MVVVNSLFSIISSILRSVLKKFPGVPQKFCEEFRRDSKEGSFKGSQGILRALRNPHYSFASLLKTLWECFITLGKVIRKIR